MAPLKCKVSGFTMLYRHRYFRLDVEAVTVFDENGKQLSFTNHLFRALLFLCEHDKAGIDELGDFISGGETDRLYTHNSIRQYQYRINQVIGHDVVLYKKQEFFINGEFLTDDSPPSQTTPETDTAEQEPVLAVPTDVGFAFLKRRVIIGASIFFMLVVSAAIIVLFQNPVGFAKPASAMVTIPAGDFIMGSTEEQALEAFRLNDGNFDKAGYLSEYPQRTVTLGEYDIDRKEVSNAEYRMFVDATNRAEPTPWSDQKSNDAIQPVTGVDWNDSTAYCEWLGKRLPTEAEWEKAARGIDGRIWPWGNTWDPTKDNHGNGSEFGFDTSDGFRYSAPVGSDLGVSPFGILNMAGNVYEWTADDFAPYPGNDKYVHPYYFEAYKVFKGGAYTDGPMEQRPASRVGHAKDFREEDIGFRCAR